MCLIYFFIYLQSMAVSESVHLTAIFFLKVYSIPHYKICQWLATCRWFSQGTAVSSINKTDRHSITEILLKVALNTITLTLTLTLTYMFWQINDITSSSNVTIFWLISYLEVLINLKEKKQCHGLSSMTNQYYRHCHATLYIP